MIPSRPRPNGPSSGWSDRARPSARRPPVRLLAAILVVPLLAGLFAAPGAPRVAADDLANARAARAQLQKKIAAQKARIADLSGLQTGLRAQIGQTSAKLDGITTDLGATRAQVAATRAQVAKVEATYEDLVLQVQQLDGAVERVSQSEQDQRQALATRRALLAERIRAAYETNRTSLLEAFLSGGSFTDILTEVSWYLDVGHQDAELAKEIQRDQETLASLHATVVDSRAQTDELRAETAAQKATLDAALAQLGTAEARLHALEVATAQALAAQRAAYAEAQRNAAALARSVAANAAAERALQQKIDGLVRDAASSGQIGQSYGGGRFAWPMPGVVTQPFGCTGFPAEPRVGSCAHFHRGIDIANAYGTPIRSAADGRVVYCGWYWQGPNPAYVVIVAHSAGLQTWYVHVIPGCPARAGAWVGRGQVIAHEGMTGNTTGPHLHWMVERNGTFVNPQGYL